jgi:hypothetical protein
MEDLSRAITAIADIAHVWRCNFGRSDQHEDIDLSPAVRRRRSIVTAIGARPDSLLDIASATGRETDGWSERDGFGDGVVGYQTFLYTIERLDNHERNAVTRPDEAPFVCL